MPPTSRFLCPDLVEANGAVEERDGERAAIDTQVEVAGIVGQTQREEVVAVGRLPEPQRSAVAPAHADRETVGVELDTPGRALERCLRPQQLGSLPRLPIEHHNQRLADAGE